MDMDVSTALPAIQTAYGLVADEVVAVADTDAVLEQYGLLKPYSAVKITPPEDLEMDTFTLSVSQPDESGNVYLRHSGTKLIYRVAASTLKWLDVQVGDIMLKLAKMPVLATLSGVTVQNGDESYAFTLSGEDDTFAVSFNGKEIPAANFRDFYQNLIAAGYEAVAEQPASSTPDDGESSGESSEEETEAPTESIVAGLTPILTYTYTYRDSSKSPDVVRFYPGPARKAYIVVNDGIVYITPITYVDKIQADLPLIAAGETVTAYL
jgi:hypothetical protein